MTWFHRTPPQRYETLMIGQVSVDVLLDYIGIVREAANAGDRVDTEPSVATVNSWVAAWLRVIALPGIAEHPLLNTVAHAQYALALCTRLSAERQEDDLETARQELERVTRFEHAAVDRERPRWLNALSVVYRRRFEAYNQRADLDRSIEMNRDAQRAAGEGSIYWERIQNTLGLGLMLRYDRTGQAQDLRDAITAYRTALAACPPGSRQWGMRQVNLAGPYIRLFELYGHVTDIDSAIHALHSAQQVIGPGAPNWGELQGQLAIALLRRFGTQGEMTDLDSAVTAARAALDSVSPAYPKRAALQNNLGLTLETRFVASGQLADLDAAVAVYRTSLTEAQAGTWNRIHFQVNLANALIRRFVLRKQVSDINEAITIYRDALGAVPARGPEWATLQNNLGVALSERYKAQHQVQDLEDSLIATRESLEATPPGTVDWAGRQGNLGSSLHDRFKHLKRHADLDAAIAAHERALTSLSEGSYDWAFYHVQMSSALATRYERERRPEDFQALFAACQRARTIFSADRWAEQALIAAQNLGAAYVMQRDWNRASDTLLEAVEIINTLYRRHLLVVEREAWLARAPNTYRRAAYALARAGRFQDAVVVLEQGRARCLSDAMGLDRVNLDRVHRVDPVAYDMYVHGVSQLRSLQADERQARLAALDASRPMHISLDHRTQIHQAQTELDGALARIRRVPGYEAFLTDPTFHDITRAVEPSAPLVYLDLVADCGFALIVYRLHDQGEVAIDPVWLEDVKIAELKDLIIRREDEGVEGSYLRGIAGDHPITDEAYLRTSLDGILLWLGDRLLGPIAAHARQLHVSAMILLPGFFLPLLPLHAARYRVGDRDVYLQDEFAVAYAPAAQALAGIHRRVGTALRPVTAIGNPTRDRLSPALFTDWLAAQVCSQLRGDMPILHRAATRQALRSELGRGAPAHLLLGCHGAFNPVEPLGSHLALADDDLTLTEVINTLQLDGTQLVTLCSCRTSIRDFAHVPDEAISFPAAFLQVGAQAVLAPLWAVHALPTVLLLRQIYRQISEGTAPIDALRRSVIWLRTMSVATYRGQVADLRQSLDATMAIELDRLAQEYSHNPQPFAAPVYWAAFCYHGHLFSEGMTNAY